MKKIFLVLGSFTLAVAVTLGIMAQAQEDVQEVALIHSLEVGDGAPTTFPAVITVKVNQPVRLYNTASDSAHIPVVISRDEDGTDTVFTDFFDALVGEVSIVEFTPDEVGTFFISHIPHGHPIVGQLIVVE